MGCAPSYKVRRLLEAEPVVGGPTRSTLGRDRRQHAEAQVRESQPASGPASQVTCLDRKTGGLSVMQ